MRILNRHCRYCIKKDCEHKKDIQTMAKSIKKNLTFIYHCKEYKTCFSVGDKVMVDMYNRIIEESSVDFDGQYDGGKVGWEKIGEFPGTIYALPRNNKDKFFIIELNNEIEVWRQGKGELDEYKEITVKGTKKRAIDIKLIEKVVEIPKTADKEEVPF
jgi:hypothetical protein